MSIGITKHNSRAGNSATSWRTGNGRSANPPSACRLPSLRRCRGFHLLVAGSVWMLTIMSGGCYGEQPPPDVTPPSFLNNYPYVSEVTASGAELHIALDEPSFVYYAVVVTGGAAPDVTAVVAGTATGAVSAGYMHYDAASLDAGRERVVRVVGLAPLTAYGVHVAAKDVAQNNVQAGVTTVTVFTAHQPHDEGDYRRYCRHLSDDSKRAMVSEFRAWRISSGAGAAALAAREAELDMLLTSCRHSSLNPERRYYTPGGDGYFLGRLGHDVMLM
mmetsp:Transcript_36784/g.91609  ORF Transcript_36784/g.91609 Transcript_36784/m.91609 type:complete len:274 (-) Transcript_36784:90-911(-)